MQSQAAEEVRHAHFGDVRLNKRLARLVEDLAAQPTASVPQACQTKAATKAAYRFWDSSRVTPKAIRKAHFKKTVERMKGHQIILAIQDTTTFDFTHHPQTKNLGPVDHPAHRGLKVHSTLAATTESVPLGLIHQEVWARDPETVGKRHRRRQREIQDKESQRWLNALKESEEIVPKDIQLVTIADREADIYDLFALPRRPNSHLLIRAAHNRRVNDEARYLWDAIRQSPVRGELLIQLGRRDNRPLRQARLTIRYKTLEIYPPHNHPNRASLQPVAVQVILAEEENPPDGETPVSWLLITTLPVTSFQEAVQCIEWYSYRWLIERYHFVLKSGCQVEKLQLEEAERIHRALATYCIVAWRLLWLTYEARRNPDAPCDTVLEVHEWQSLYCTIHKTPVPPPTPPTLHKAVHWIAQLGGFLGRKRDGDPGVKTIWRGLCRLHDIAATWKLLHSTSLNQVEPDLWVMHSLEGGI
jgi:hypothetical protein